MLDVESVPRVRLALKTPACLRVGAFKCRRTLRSQAVIKTWGQALGKIMGDKLATVVFFSPTLDVTTLQMYLCGFLCFSPTAVKENKKKKKKKRSLLRRKVTHRRMDPRPKAHRNYRYGLTGRISPYQNMYIVAAWGTHKTHTHTHNTVGVMWGVSGVRWRRGWK